MAREGIVRWAAIGTGTLFFLWVAGCCVLRSAQTSTSTEESVVPASRRPGQTMLQRIETEEGLHHKSAEGVPGHRPKRARNSA